MDRDKEIRQAIEVLEDGFGEGLSGWESDELESYLEWRDLIGSDSFSLPSDLQARISIIDQKLRDSAKTIIQTVNLPVYRAIVNPPRTHWWWFLDEIGKFQPRTGS